MHAARLLNLACLVTFAVVLNVGCSSEPKDPFEDWDAGKHHEEFVPATAQPVKSGTGVLEFTTPEAGTLYLMDTSKTVQVEGFAKPSVLLAGLVPAGQTVIFDPAEKRIRVQGREGVRVRDVDATHTHEFRFDPTAKKPEAKKK
jgi:hypothetical protein